MGTPFLLGSNVYPYPAQPFNPTLVDLYWVHNPKIKNQITTFVICLGTSLIKNMFTVLRSLFLELESRESKLVTSTPSQRVHPMS